MTEVMGLNMERLNHDCFKIQGDDKTVYTDPYKIDVEDEADLVLVSHEHFDHCSREDIEKVSGENTVLVVNASSQSKVSSMKVRDLKAVRPGEKLEAAGIPIETVKAYNVNKFRAPEQPFHPEEDEHCGYVFEIDGVRVYHTGDTDVIDEMDKVECDIALVPVSGTYVMTAEEAAEAVKKIRPKVAIPMHYGEVIGDRSDAEKFRDLVGKEAEVKIL